MSICFNRDSNVKFVPLVIVFAIALVVTVSGNSPGPATASADENAVDTIGGSFAMIDDEGKPVTEAAIKGKPTVMFFGFTNCPEVCPTTLFELSGLMEKPGSDADRLNAGRRVVG